MTSSTALKVIHTVTTTRASYGGPSRSVPFLCEALAEQDTSVRLVTTVPNLSGGEQAAILPSDPVSVCRAGVGNGAVQTLRRPLSFYRALQDQSQAARPDVVHDHGLWLPTHGTIAFAARRLNVPLVVSTRGMLTPWALQHNRWRKQFVWTAYQEWALQQAALFHVTSEEEVEALRDLGLNQPVALIPNGVQLPEPYDPEAPPPERRRALFLSRLHPKKGLPMLLEAWAEVRPENWELVLVGPSEENHRDDLEEQVRRHELGKMVRFAGAVSEEEKWEVYRKSDLFVLPSHSENFGIVVAEALAAGLPAITTTGTPWQELEGRNCGWWVEPEAGPLAEALREAFHCSPKTLREMGQRGRALVKERYTWGGVAAQLRASYQWILGEADRPACVQV